MSTFSIVPIAGREVIQKNFVTLPSKAKNYSNRRISLNERFSLIERGYSLQPQDTVMTARDVKLMYAVPDKAELSELAEDAYDKYLDKQTRQAGFDSADARARDAESQLIHENQRLWDELHSLREEKRLLNEEIAKQQAAEAPVLGDQRTVNLEGQDEKGPASQECSIAETTPTRSPVASESADDEESCSPINASCPYLSDDSS